MLFAIIIAAWPAKAVVYYATNYSPASSTTMYAACLYGDYRVPGSYINLSTDYIPNSNVHLHVLRSDDLHQ